MIPFARLMELDSAAAVRTPPQVLEITPVPLTIRPAGRVSVKATLVRGIVLGLTSVNVRLVFVLIGNTGVGIPGQGERHSGVKVKIIPG